MASERCIPRAVASAGCRPRVRFPVVTLNGHHPPPARNHKIGTVVMSASRDGPLRNRGDARTPERGRHEPLRRGNTEKAEHVRRRVEPPERRESKGNAPWRRVPNRVRQLPQYADADADVRLVRPRVPRLTGQEFLSAGGMAL